MMEKSMTPNRDWTLLTRTGAAAALIAAIVFRRNIGAEVSLFTGFDAIPQSIAGWFALLQSNPFVGLSFLALFDIANGILVGLILLALGVVLWPVNKSLTAIALTSGMTGIAVSLGNNISLSMLSLSHQYAAATSVEQQAALLTGGQALLAGRDPLAIFPGTGWYVSLLLIALAGMLFSLVMLRSYRKTAVVGMLASGCDLAYCLTFTILPGMHAVWIASAGLFWMIWHLLVGRVLLRLASRDQSQ
jgi:hypothetical protein